MKVARRLDVEDTKKITDEKYREALKKYSILIRSLARKLSSGQPAGLDYDDLCSSGRIGLLQAMEKFDPKQKKQFSSYVKYRIRGSMLDAIRAHDFIPRSVKDKAKRVKEATEELRNLLDREPTNNEVAKKLGVSKESAHKLIRETRKCTIISTEDIKNYSEKERTKILDSISSSNPLQSPSNSFIQKDVRENLVKVLSELRANERKIIMLYYFEDLSYKEIGEKLSLTESRISQLHTQAIRKLRKEFSNEIKSILLG